MLVNVKTLSGAFSGSTMQNFNPFSSLNWFLTLKGLLCSLVTALWMTAPALAQNPAVVVPPNPSTGIAGSVCPVLLHQSFLRLQDEKPQDLCQYSGKVLLVVNTASFCGFTHQYEGLEALHAKYKDRGLVVLGFPSNDFSQETGSNKEIAAFCENTFNVKFPMFAKSSVRGSTANPLFKQLASTTGTTPRWNFYKYLVGRDGLKISAFNSSVEPQDPRFVKALETLLSAK